LTLTIESIRGKIGSVVRGKGKRKMNYLVIIVSHEHGVTCSGTVTLDMENENREEELQKALHFAKTTLGDDPDEIFLIQGDQIRITYDGYAGWQ